MANTAGAAFRTLIAAAKHGTAGVEATLPLLGVTTGFQALSAKQNGAKALFLPAAGVASMNHGLPDLGLVGLGEMVEDARRITSVCDLPLLVDGDTGYGSGSHLNIQQTVRQMEQIGACGVVFMDQDHHHTRRHRVCNSRKKKQQIVDLLPKEVMVDKIRAAVDARRNDDFVIVARCDAIGVEDLEGTIERLSEYAAAGADMVLPECVDRVKQFQSIRERLARENDTPVIASVADLGQTPYFSVERLSKVGVSAVMFPMTISRTSASIADAAMKTILVKGEHSTLMNMMQSRARLYQVLDYAEYLPKVSFHNRDRKSGVYHNRDTSPEALKEEIAARQAEREAERAKQTAADEAVAKEIDEEWEVDSDVDDDADEDVGLVLDHPQNGDEGDVRADSDFDNDPILDDEIDEEMREAEERREQYQELVGSRMVSSMVPDEKLPAPARPKK